MLLVEAFDPLGLSIDLDHQHEPTLEQRLDGLLGLLDLGRIVPVEFHLEVTHVAVQNIDPADLFDGLHSILAK